MGNWTGKWRGTHAVKCQCECGKVTEIDGEKLRRGHTNSCGCLKHENKGRFKDLSGQQFGRLRVVHFVPKNERESPRKKWLCKCECGNYIQTEAAKLNSGHTCSCGCLKNEYKESIRNLNRKYNCTNKRLESVYYSMIHRCYFPNDRSYHNYGGRGITVCDEWKDNFDSFAEWAFSNGYNPDAKRGNCTLERLNVNKGYCPNNCCWITNKQQQNNRRDCHRIEYNNEIHTISEWAEKLNMSYSTLYNGILTYGKTIEDYIND